MQFACNKDELMRAIGIVAHKINNGLTGNGSQTAEEITTAQDQTQTEELTEQTTQDSSRTATNTDSTKPETKPKPRAGLSDEATAARRAYEAQYRARNRDRLNAYAREWHKMHPEKNKEYMTRHWERKARELAAAMTAAATAGEGYAHE